VHVAAAQRLGVDDLARRRFHQRRSAEEDRALILHDDRLVAHGGHVGAAGGARAEHDRELRNAVGRQARLVVEDAPEVLAIRKHLVLHGQERAAGVHQVDARQAVLQRDLLRAQVLLHGDGEVRAALHRGVVGDDDDRHAANAPDAGDEPGAGRLSLVHVARGEARQLEER
jgi:hypothetical protein